MTLSSSVSIAIGGASAYPFTASNDQISDPSSISSPLNSAPSTLLEPSASVGIEIIISGVESESKLAITGPGSLM